MVAHEKKSCPNCGKLFECRYGSITICQCFDLNIKTELYDEIKIRFDDCICRDCLLFFNKNFKKNEDMQGE